MERKVVSYEAQWARIKMAMSYALVILFILGIVFLSIESVRYLAYICLALNAVIFPSLTYILVWEDEEKTRRYKLFVFIVAIIVGVTLLSVSIFGFLSAIGALA